jgi:folate-binding protein YgfZ
VEIDDAGGELRVWARWGDEASAEGAAAIEAASSGDGAAWPADPRLAALGRRGIAPAGWAPAAPPAPAAAYRAARLRLGVAEGGAEVPPGEAVALEYNIDGLRGISFTKGCYVGQELMARTHFKGVVRKRLMPVEVDLAAAAAAGAPPPAAGDDVFEAPGGAGRPVGRLRAVEGGAGAALLRLAPALAAAAEARPLFTAGGAPLRPRRPDWWPPHWGREEA